MMLWTLWLACSGNGDGTEPSPTDSGSDTSVVEATGETGDTTPDETGDTGEATTCAPSVEVGTGTYSFESLEETLTMVNGPQGGWHVVSSMRLCDLGRDATMSFTATRESDGVDVGGSGTLTRILIPDGPCCYVATDVFTYLLVPEVPVPADVLHDEPVRMKVEVTLPDSTVHVDEVVTRFQDPRITGK